MLTLALPFGGGFVHNVAVAHPHLPRSHRALKGWSKSSPEAMREPMPWEVCLLAVNALATIGVTTLGDWALVAAHAFLFHFDVYCRPGELLSIRGRDIVPPSGQNRCWVAIVGPAPFHA